MIQRSSYLCTVIAVLLSAGCASTRYAQIPAAKPVFDRPIAPYARPANPTRAQALQLYHQNRAVLGKGVYVGGVLTNKRRFGDFLAASGFGQLAGDWSRYVDEVTLPDSVVAGEASRIGVSVGLGLPAPLALMFAGGMAAVGTERAYVAAQMPVIVQDYNRALAASLNLTGLSPEMLTADLFTARDIDGRLFMTRQKVLDSDHGWFIGNYGASPGQVEGFMRGSGQPAIADAYKGARSRERTMSALTILSAVAVVSGIGVYFSHVNIKTNEYNGPSWIAPMTVVGAVGSILFPILGSNAHRDQQDTADQFNLATHAQ